MRMKSLGLCLLLAMALGCSSAFAEIQLVGRAAAGFPSDGFGNVSSPSPMVAGDLTYGMTDYFQMGATYDHNFLSYKGGGGSGTMNFYGGIARFSFFSGAFVDFQGGLCEENGSSTSFSWGAGLGYAMPMSPWIDFSPRVGYRSLPVGGVTQSMFDLGAMLSFKFL